MKKKEFLTEAKRKAIIADKEKAIIESFAKTFNKIKRIDENVINEVDSFEIASKNVSEVVRENDGPNAKYLTIKFNDGSEMYMYQNMRLGKRFALPKEFESKNYEAAYLNYILENSGHRFWEIYEFFNNMAIDGDSEESLNEFENETPKKFKPMDIVIWSPKKTRWKNEYGVRYGAKAKVIEVLGDMLKIEWLKDPSNLNLVGGQMDGNYFTDDFELADVNQNDHEDYELEESLNELEFDMPRKPVTNDDMGKWEDRERMKHRIEAKFNGLNVSNSEDHNRRGELGDGNLVIQTNGNLSPEVESEISRLATENGFGFESFMDGLYLIYQGDSYGNKYQGSL